MGQYVGCVRYILFIFNFFLWLLGCALLSVGIWMKVDSDADRIVKQTWMLDVETVEEFQISYSIAGEKDFSVTLSYLLIVFGIVIIIVTFIGCCGAVKENMCLLGAFAVCLFVLMVALLSLGTWAFIKKDKLEVHTEELRNRTDANLNKGITLYSRSDPARKFIDNIQRRLRCCGLHDALTEYRRLPESCQPDSKKVGCSRSYHWYVGNEIKEVLKKRYPIIAGVAIGAALFLVIGITFGVLLCCLIRRATRLVVS